MQQHFFDAHSPLIHAGQNEAILQLFLQVMALAKEENIGYQQLMAGLIIQLLGQIYTIQKSSGLGSETEKLIKEAKFAMLSHLDTTLDGKRLSDQLNVSYSWFRKIFKQYTGLPPVQYHMQLRLQKAQDLLTTSSLTVKEIAYHLGFNSRFYFTRLFTQKTGITPTAFRAKARRGIQ
jgi:AraC-like DNA-binding protein